MSSVLTPSKSLRGYFYRSWMPLEKPLLFPTRVSPWFTSVFSKTCPSISKTGSTGPKTDSTGFWTVPSVTSDLPVCQSKAVRKSRMQSFSKIGSTGIKTGSTGFCTVPLCHFLTCQSASQSCQKKSCAYFLKTGSTGCWPGSTLFGAGRVSGWVPQWTENPWWKPV